MWFISKDINFNDYKTSYYLFLKLKMVLSILLWIFIVFSQISISIASCPNYCNGHGACNSDGICSCYPPYDASADCSRSNLKLYF